MATHAPVSGTRSRRNLDIWRRLRDSAWSYLFIAPMLVLGLTFVVYPMLGSVHYAFYNWTGFGEPTQFVGLRHFTRVATDRYFWNAFKNTLFYTLVLVPVQLSLSLALALVLNNPRLRFSSFYRAVYFLPVITSMAVVGIVLRLLFARLSANFPDWLIATGLVDPALGLLSDPKLVMWVITAVGIWGSFGYNLVFFLAALQTVPQEIYDAATVDGAGRWTTFWFITLPLIRPIGTIIMFLAIIGSLNVFDVVWVLTQGGPLYASDVVSTYIYGYAFTSARGTSVANLGYASATALFMSLLVMLVTVCQAILVGRARRRRSEYAL